MAGYPPNYGGGYAPGSANYGDQPGFPPGYIPPYTGAPPQQYGAPPPQAYGAPYGAPPPQQYGAPYGQPPPQQYGAPYGAPPQQYGAPPPQQYQQGPPPGQQWGQQPPQGNYGPPPGQYQQGPPPGQYQQGPPQGQYQQGPPQPAAQSYAPAPAAAPAPAPAPAAHAPAPAAAAPAPAPVAAAAAAPAPAPVDPLAAKISQLTLEKEVQGTIRPYPNFNPEEDAKIIRKAMKGMGTDEAPIIEILSTRCAAQRKQIALYFKTMYGKDMKKDLKGELSGNFEAVVVRMFYDNDEFDAWCLRRAMKGAGTDECALIEILCTRSNADIKRIKAAYKEEYGRDLEADINSETSGHFKRVLISSCQGNRQEGVPIDFAKAKAEAEELYKAGEKKWGTDESKFNQILMLRSFPQLRATFEEYRKISSYDITRSIDHEMSGDLKRAFKAVIQCVKDKPRYFAERLYECMKGAGTDDETLMRVVVGRSEIDMVQIKAQFFDLYNKSLAKMIKDDTSGDYKKILVGMVGEG